MLYADFESILKPADEQHKKRINKMKTERKNKTPYREKIKRMWPLDVPIHAHSTFALKIFLIH